MSVLRSGGAVLATLLLAMVVSTDLAGACTCDDRDERDLLEDGERALIGRVVAERVDQAGFLTFLRLRVERSVGMKLGGEIPVALDSPDCGPGMRLGRRVAMFIRRTRPGWSSEGCRVVEPSALVRALRPYPRPRGGGRAVLLAAGRFGEARVMALDARGRVLGYGFGGGEARRISVCPRSRLAAELVVDGPTVKMAVRDLTSLEVLREARLPVNTSLEPEQGTVHCADAGGSSVHVAIEDYLRRTRFDRVRIYRMEGAASQPVATVRGFTTELGPATAYVGGTRGVTAIDLGDGSTTRLSQARFAEFIAVSPDGARLALYARGRLRVIDLGGQEAERSLAIRSGGALEWLGPDRLLFREGDDGRVYDGALRLVRKYPFFRAYGQAQVAERLYGTAGYRLRSLDLESGRKRTVAELPDRGILDLVGLPEQPDIEPGTRRPPAPAAGQPFRLSSWSSGAPRSRSEVWNSIPSGQSMPTCGSSKRKPDSRAGS